MLASTYLIDDLPANLFFYFFLVGLIAFLVFLYLAKRTAKIDSAEAIDSFEYRTSSKFLTQAEHSFFYVLKNVLSNEYEIFAQVRMADVLYPNYPRRTSKWQIAFNKIASKHFDYLLCDKQTLAIVAAIELDDKSHQQNDRKNRDFLLKMLVDLLD